MTTSDDDLMPAYILHARRYRDTSLIAELLTRDEGRVAVVVKGAHARRPRFPGRLQPFVPLLISWSGRGELKTARNIDFPDRAFQLSGDALMIGLYVNELLYRLLGKFDPMPTVFSSYRDLLSVLERTPEINDELRRFELILLAELGYGITFNVEAHSGEPVHPDRLYRYVVEEGFHPLPDGVYEERPSGTFEGRHLLAIARGELADPAIEQNARKITRASLQVLLGDRPLKSREILMKKRGQS